MQESSRRPPPTTHSFPAATLSVRPAGVPKGRAPLRGASRDLACYALASVLANLHDFDSTPTALPSIECHPSSICARVYVEQEWHFLNPLNP